MLVVAVLLAAAAPAARVAAVLELRNKLEGADRNLVDAAFLTDVVRQQVLEDAPSVKLMTRENVLTLLEASGKKLEECEGECEVDTGRRLGADVVVTGEILRFGRGFRANLRLHDTHSAQLLSAAVASGDSPEALEKDLVRAVGKLAAPLAQGYQPEARSPEWFETIGIYLTGGVGSMSVENDTPRTLAPPANSLTLSNPKNQAVNFGLGVQYRPWKWLMIDAQYLFTTLSASVSSVSGDGRTDEPTTLSSPAVAISVNAPWRIAQVLRAFGGIGVQYFFAKIAPDNRALDAGDAVNLANAGGTGTFSTNAEFARPFARIGLELRPQDRFGIQLFGVLYPFAKEVDVYAHNVQNAQGTDLPVLKYTLPVVTGNAALVLYF